MGLFLLGLVVFLGVHSTKIAAPDWRQSMIARFGLGTWKGLYSLVSIVGFVALVYGFGLARQDSVVVWSPPLFMRHVTALFTLVAFIFFVAAYVPRNSLKFRFGHPMLLSVKIWAVGHLLANGTLADIILFGAFLVWAVIAFVFERRRDRTAGVTYPAGTTRGNVLTIAIGLVAFLVFAFYLHRLLIGVDPMA
ncbi:MAG: NnrU family protein [Burkholderiaceae bacterium]|jgi:uncharacterized membrane protein